MRKRSSLVIFIFVILLASCKKIEMKPPQNGDAPANLSLSNNTTIFNAAFIPQDDDSIERITVLGARLTNPYLIPNMTQAYHDLGIYNVPVVVTNLYVRFKPTIAQLSILDSTMDAQNLELFDTPADYDVTYEGDYYQDPSIPDSLPTWQYAVVPPAFIFPAGIQHETLAQIHIPSDAYTAVETEAENLALGGGNMSVANGAVHPDVPICLPGYHLEGTVCVPDDCPANYHWNGTTCVPNNCPTGYYWTGTTCAPYQINPPPPAPDAAIPAGYIRVHDTNLNTDPGVRKTRMVARRWFKVETSYTDDNGHFVFTKKFKHKVRINVKFKNDYASIRGMRGVRLWQMFFAVKKTLGIFSGDKSNILYVASLFQTIVTFPGVGPVDVTASNKSTRYWAAATTLNTVQEYRDYATTEQIGLPPAGIRIVLSNYGKGTGFTPMYGKRGANDVAAEFVEYFLSPAATVVSGIVNIFKDQVDIGGSYNFRGPNNASGYEYLRSDAMKELFYHELTHAAHYNALGNGWYTSFVANEAFEIISNFSSGYAPYGNGVNGNSPQVALGESWAYHIGQYFADKKYVASSDAAGEQFTNYPNGFIVGLNSHLVALENFDPHLANYPFDWIPKGVYYDMIDTRNEASPVIDAVSGFTNQNFFNAFSSSILTLAAYKQNLISQNPTNPTINQVNNLFAQYGY